MELEFSKLRLSASSASLESSINGKQWLTVCHLPCSLILSHSFIMRLATLINALAIVGLASAVTQFLKRDGYDFPNNACSLDNPTLTLSFSEGCWGTTGGGASCTQFTYMHAGDGNSGCNDPPTPFTIDYCKSTSGMPTTKGDGTFTPADTCDDGGNDGIVMGSIRAGGVTWKCTKSGKRFDTDCGENFASQNVMVCTAQ
jgi:hypothetical protein